ncbi:MAG TPA: calcium-binding protein [Solirubrobacteraceae bacterium]
MRLPLALAASTVALLGAAPAAHGAVTCVLNGSTVEVTGEPGFAEVYASGGEIKVDTESTTVDCGSATPSNTDAIVITAPPDVEAGGEAGGHRIAGGLTDEPGTTDEIEITVTGYPFAFALGTSGPDEFSAGRMPDGSLVADLDAGAGDDDVDLVAIGVTGELELAGVGGEDVMRNDGTGGTGAPDFAVNLLGFGGNDTLVGGGAMSGGAGDDAITGIAGPRTDAFADYRGVPDPVHVTLPGGTLPGMDGVGGTDTYTDVVSVAGGGGADRLVAGAQAAFLTGSGGDDELVGGPAADTLVGNLGDDTIRGNGGDDVFSTTTSGPDGADDWGGGDGVDSLFYGATRAQGRFVGRTASVFVTLGDGPGDGEIGEGDDVRGDVEYVTGGSGDDTLIGNDAGNQLGGLMGMDTLDGRGGDDIVEGDGAFLTELVDAGNVVIGGAGPDRLTGGEGPDDLRAADGEADTLTCGDGVDFGPFDAGDTLADDCEQRPGPAPPPAPPGPPIVFPGATGDPVLAQRGRPRARRRRGGRFRLNTGLAAVCPANGPPCVVRVSLKVRRRGGKLFITRKTRPVTLAAGSELRIVRLLTPVASHLLRRRGTLTAILRATFRRGGGPLIAREAALILRAPRRGR